MIRYDLTIFALTAAQLAVGEVIAYGYVATAVIVLVGPIFVPFFIVPQLEWLFLGVDRSSSTRSTRWWRTRSSSSSATCPAILRSQRAAVHVRTDRRLLQPMVFCCYEREDHHPADRSTHAPALT